MNKQKVRPAMYANATAQEVRFQQEYKKALKQQNKTFNQNGNFSSTC